jgi:hypothetical protein
LPTSAPNSTGSLKPEVGYTDLVRNSRDGDQFHYTWAARQSLRLLDLNTSFRCMFIEGASPADSLAKTGEESIDLSEYWGGESLENADSVVYRQLKHSSVRTHQPWAASELASTFEGFARWYFDAVKQHPEAADRIRFEIVTNRPCSNRHNLGVNQAVTLRWGPTS